MCVWASTRLVSWCFESSQPHFEKSCITNVIMKELTSKYIPCAKMKGGGGGGGITYH